MISMDFVDSDNYGGSNGSGFEPNIFFEFNNSDRMVRISFGRDILEKHLKNPDSGLSAPELISLFLYQAGIAATTARDIKNKRDLSNGDVHLDQIKGENFEDVIENKKVKLLKLLAVKTACHLDWNLEELQQKLPVAILRSLLLEFGKIVNAGDLINAVNFAFDSLEPETIFALILYHRWCLTTIIRDFFPTKPSRVPNVQVPGLLDPSVSSAVMKDSILKELREDMDRSLDILEKYLASGKETRMPVMSCIGMINEDGSSEHTWSNGLLIEPAEMACQISYDLGCTYFYQRNYEQAYIHFKQSKELLGKLQKPVFCKVEGARLDGYFCACAGVTGNTGNMQTLYERVQGSLQNNFHGLTGLLIEDLVKQELSLTFRGVLEDRSSAAQRADSLYEEVLVVNTIRRSLEGKVAIYDLVKTMNRTAGLVEFFIKVCLDIHNRLPENQKENLKAFLRNLCFTLSPSTRFVEILLKCELHKLFSPSECLSLKITPDPVVPLVDVPFTFPNPADEVMRIAETEKELLTSYDIVRVKELVEKLIGVIPRYNLLFLSDKWRIPKELHQCIECLPNSQPIIPTFTHILVSKGRMCIQLKLYDKARELLMYVDNIVKDSSYKLSKLIRWEIHKIDLLQYLEFDTMTSDMSLLELAKRSKACIASLQLEQHDLQPTQDVVCYSIAFLLNVRDWDYLVTLTTNNYFVQFSQMMCTLCKELTQMKTARTLARNFIETVGLIFSSSMKRPGPGMAGPMPNNMPVMSHESLLMLIGKIKEETILSLLISCLTKLLMFADDSFDDIFSDFMSFWPTATNNQSLDRATLLEVVGFLMDHALTVNPQQSSWVRTQADLSFVTKEHWMALKYYVYLGVVMTDFFSEPITKNAYDDQVYKKMIHCCSQLNCHTQVAVLCQFLDETDYTLAFKALQERPCADAMDGHYDCFWDSTILEYIINLHTKRAELDKRNYAIKLIGQPELNSNNRHEILHEAAKMRKARFMRSLAKQYLGLDSAQPIVKEKIAT